MNYKFLTDHPYFNEKFLSIGFKRQNRRKYIRKCGDAVDSLQFGRAHYGEHFVSYYSFTVFIDFKEIDKTCQNIGVLIGGFGIPIYILCNEKYYKDWRVANEDSEKYVKKVIDDMADVVKRYAIPFLDKYPTIQDVIKGIEEKKINRYLDERRLTPILYLLNGEKARAIDYVNETLQRMQEEKIKLLNDYEMGKCEEPLFKDLDVYIDYADKFKKYTRESHTVPGTV